MVEAFRQRLGMCLNHQDFTKMISRTKPAVRVVAAE
jgi:hypothetical protein